MVRCWKEYRMTSKQKEILFQKLWKSYVVIILGTIFFAPIISSLVSILFVITIAWYQYQNTPAKQRFNNRKKMVLFFSGIYWIALLGLLWTENENLYYGFAALETQLSILVFPLIFSFIQVTKKDILEIIKFLAVLFLIAFISYFLFTIFRTSENFSLKLLLDRSEERRVGKEC